ncbi:MAG: hypothetical protein AAF517_22070, partial [Planctomycetota bacterium]
MRKRRVLFWLGAGLFALVAWFVWDRVTEHILLEKLEEARQQEGDDAWMSIAEELIDGGSRRVIAPILSCIFQPGLSPDLVEPVPGADDGRGLLEKLRVEFGDSTVWRESMGVVSEFLSSPDEYVRKAGEDAFWVEDPGSALFSTSAQTFARSRILRVQAFGISLVPLATRISLDEKAAIFREALKSTSPLVIEAVARAIQSLDFGSSHDDLLRAVRKVSSGLPEGVHPADAFTDGHLKHVLWNLEAQYGTESTGKSFDDLVRLTSREGGWFDQAVDDFGRVTSTRGSEFPAFRLVERGAISAERFSSIHADLRSRWASPLGAGLGGWSAALARAGTVSAFDQLLGQLNVEFLAERALGRFRGEEFERRLLAAWNDVFPLRWREDALLALGWMRATSSAAHEHIRKCLASDELAWAAIYASRWCYAELPIARRAVELMHLQERPWQRLRSADVPYDSGLVGLVGPESAPDVEWLVEGLQVLESREWALRALVRIGPPAARALDDLRKLAAELHPRSDSSILLLALEAIIAIDGPKPRSLELITDVLRENDWKHERALDLLVRYGFVRELLEAFPKLTLFWWDCRMPTNFVQFVSADGSLLSSLPDQYQWLVDWRSENRRRRARAVAYLRRRLAPQRTRDGIGIDLFDCE